MLFLDFALKKIAYLILKQDCHKKNILSLFINN